MGKSLEVLNEYRRYLITEEPLPDGLVVYCSTLAPALFSENDIPKTAYRLDKNEAEELKAFRLGIFRLPEFDTIDWCFRSIIINSYVFYLFASRVRVYIVPADSMILSLSLMCFSK